MIVTSVKQVTEEERLTWLGKPYAFDIESTGLNFMTDKLIGLAVTVNNKDYYFVLEHSTGNEFETKTYLSIEDLRLLVAPLFSQKDVVCIAHNSGFDLHFLRRYELTPQGKLFDTLIAAQLLNENRRNGLKSLTSLVDEEHSKYETMRVYNQFPKGSPLAVPLQEFAEYAKKDTSVTMKLYDKFSKELPKDSFRGRSIQDVFNELWMPLIPVLCDMESRGFRLNTDKVKELVEEYSTKVKNLEKEIEKQGIKMLSEKYKAEDVPKVYWKMLEDHDYVEEEDGKQFLYQYGIKTPVLQPTPRSKPRKIVFNPGSRTQINDLVFHNLDVPAQAELKYTPTGEVSVDADTLKILKFYLKDETPDYIDTLLELRISSKFLGTYLEPFLAQSINGRIHANFNLAVSEAGGGGTVSGRLSSSNPNLQNLPSRGEIGSIARDLFIPSEGMKLVVCDYSNVEREFSRNTPVTLFSLKHSMINLMFTVLLHQVLMIFHTKSFWSLLKKRTRKLRK